MMITEHFVDGQEISYRVGRYDASLSHPRFGPIRRTEIYIRGELVAVPELEFRASEVVETETKFNVNVEDWYLEINK